MPCSHPQSASAKQKIRTLFQHAIVAETLDIAQIESLVSPEYRQTVDGITLDYPQFIDHLRAQRETIRRMSVTFLTLIAEGNRVCSHHQITVEKKNGARAVAQVIALFTLRAGKIIACNELTHLLSGAPEDRDLGSRR